MSAPEQSELHRCIHETLNHAEIFLLCLLAGSCKFCNGSSRCGLGGLSAGVGVNFGIENEDIDVFAGCKNLMEPPKPIS